MDQASHQHALAAAIQWFKTWRTTGNQRHLHTALACYHIAQEHARRAADKPVPPPGAPSSKKHNSKQGRVECGEPAGSLPTRTLIEQSRNRLSEVGTLVSLTGLLVEDSRATIDRSREAITVPRHDGHSPKIAPPRNPSRTRTEGHRETWAEAERWLDEQQARLHLPDSDFARGI